MVEKTRLIMRPCAIRKQVVKIIEKIHTQNSFDFYSKPVIHIWTIPSVVLSATWSIRSVSFMIQIVADGFPKKRNGFWYQAAGAKDTEWIGPIYGESVQALQCRVSKQFQSIACWPKSFLWKYTNVCWLKDLVEGRSSDQRNIKHTNKQIPR